MRGTANTNRVVISAEEAWADQERLDEICRKPAHESREIFIANDMYGHASILKAYSLWPAKRPLKVVIPHGPSYRLETRWDYEKNVCLPMIAAHTEELAQDYMKWTGKTVRLIASPYLYLLEIMRDQPVQARQGTIFFPLHSTENVMVETDFALQADELLKLDQTYQPITVCIYWVDYLKGHHLPFQERGFRIVSAGCLTHVSFLARLHHLMARHTYAMSCFPGTHTMLSIASGCTFLSYGTHWKHLGRPENQERYDVHQLLKQDRMDRFQRMFRWDDPLPREEQLAWANHYLGREWLGSPAHLAGILAEAEWLDRFSFTVRNPGHPTRFIMPTLLRRTLQHARHRVTQTFSLGRWQSATSSS